MWDSQLEGFLVMFKMARRASCSCRSWYCRTLDLVKFFWSKALWALKRGPHGMKVSVNPQRILGRRQNHVNGEELLLTLRKAQILVDYCSLLRVLKEVHLQLSRNSTQWPEFCTAGSKGHRTLHHVRFLPELVVTVHEILTVFFWQLLVIDLRVLRWDHSRVTKKKLARRARWQAKMRVVQFAVPL